MITIKRSHFIMIIVLVVFFESLKFVFAWTGPTSAPPNGNVNAPINVGIVDQVKNAGLGINSLAVFGNAIISGTARYLNFGTTAGSAGYGIRDNAGTLEFKNSNGNWQNMLSAASTFTQIRFSDGTVQTTAASSSAQGTQVPMYLCPSVGGGACGGGAWGYYECRGQVSSKSTCVTIEYPQSCNSSCAYIGTMVLQP